MMNDYIIVGDKLKNENQSAIYISNDGLQCIVLNNEKNKSNIHEDLELKYIGGNIYEVVKSVIKINKYSLFGVKEMSGLC